MQKLIFLSLLVAVVIAHTGGQQHSKPSLIRRDYHHRCERGVNEQVALELRASYVYQAMAWYFTRSDVALPGFHKFFEAASKEEREHASQFIEYQNKRGGNTVYLDIPQPVNQQWASPVEAVREALDLEKQVLDKLQELHGFATEFEDYHLIDFIESNFFTEQVEAIKDLGDLVTRLDRAGFGLGEIVVDKQLQDA